MIKQVVCDDAPVEGDLVSVPCPTAIDDTYIAVGVEFVDGVKSTLAHRGVS